eukprot:1005570-Pleurochrysis_carterae.AAC.3
MSFASDDLQYFGGKSDLHAPRQVERSSMSRHQRREGGTEIAHYIAKSMQAHISTPTRNTSTVHAARERIAAA